MDRALGLLLSFVQARLILTPSKQSKRICFPGVYHREHTILLSRERVNKGTERMNSLPLSPVVISYAT